MARHPAPLPLAIPWPVFTRREALAAGVHPERLRRADLVLLRRGLFRRREHQLTERDLVLALCRSDPRLVVVGVTAARLHRIPLPGRLDAESLHLPVRMGVPGGRRGSDRTVRWHNIDPQGADVETRAFAAPLPDGTWSTEVSARLRVTTRARTWRDLAPLLSHERLVSIGDHLVRQPRPDLETGRTAPWCSIDELREQCTGRHATVLRRALDEVQIGADSPMETMLRLRFRTAGLPEPLLNQPLIGDDGTVLHSPDLQWPRYRVCAEYDGAHHEVEAQMTRDIRRGRRASAGGWTEIRLFAGDLEDDCAEAVRLVVRALAQAGWVPPPHLR